MGYSSPIEGVSFQDTPHHGQTIFWHPLGWDFLQTDHMEWTLVWKRLFCNKGPPPPPGQGVLK